MLSMIKGKSGTDSKNLKRGDSRKKESKPSHPSFARYWPTFTRNRQKNLKGVLSPDKSLDSHWRCSLAFRFPFKQDLIFKPNIICYGIPPIFDWTVGENQI